MRILFSFLIIAFMPFFMEEEERSKTPLEPDTKYCNPRYSFCINFPDTLLPTQLVSDNHDGIILRSEDDQVVVTVAGSRAVMGRDTWDLYDDFVGEWIADNPDGRLIYEIIERPYYQVSFIDGGHHYWQKLFNMGNKYVIYQIVAPKEDKEKIDQIRKNLEITFDV